MNNQTEKRDFGQNLKNIYDRTHPLVFISVTITLISIIIMLIIWAINLKSLPPKIPLFYSLPWGEQQLVSALQFVILPAIVILIGLINLIISLLLHPSQLIVKILLHITTAIVALLTLVTTWNIIYTFI